MTSYLCFITPFQLAARKVRCWLSKDSDRGPDEAGTGNGAGETSEIETRTEDREDAPLLGRKRTPTTAIRKATVAEASDSSETPAKTPSPTSLTPVSSPGEYSSSSLSRSRGSTHRHSRASSKSSKGDKHSLEKRLLSARRESPRHPHMFFVPICDQQKLITLDAVARDIQICNPQIEEEEALDYAKKACEYARRLYAVLACVKRGGDIGNLLTENITDKVLPLKRKDDDQGLFILQRPDDQTIQRFELWDTKEREDFDRIQWWMTSPIFEDKEHYELDDEAILPFVRYKATGNTQKPHHGGYSEVYPVRVHPAHHRFWESDADDDQRLVAIKKLISTDETEFKKEATILRTLGSKRTPHPHLIQLLATYRQDQRYHLMFPFANANLRRYWEDEPTPSFDEVTVLWSLKQMTGLANALMIIHNFKVTVPLSVAGARGGNRVQKDAALSVRKGEEWFGRHGDIKPENILWFRGSPQTSDARGILQIADFGLGRFHGRDSRSRVDPETILTSPTYEPPECKLHRPVSRAYDLWSLGCVYLEFVTWLLEGANAIEDFADFRGKTSSIGINEDNFFTIIRDHTREDEAVLREEVGVWAERLHENTKCSELVHELIDLTMEQLLIVDSNNRVSAGGLSWDMKKFLDRAETDKDYMLKSGPLKPKQRSWARSNSTSAIPGRPRRTEDSLKYSTSSLGTANTTGLTGTQADVWKELPSITTPAPRKTKKKSVTWPPSNELSPVHEQTEQK